MVTVKDKFLVLKQIYSNPISIVTFLAFSVLIYLLNAVIIQWKNLHFIKTLGISLFTTGFYYSIEKAAFYTTITISVLTGLLLSLLVYRSTERVNKKDFSRGTLSSLAVFLGLLAPGCISCGIGLAATLGLGAAFASLPFRGIEIAVVAILLLVYSINKTLISFVQCIIPLRKKK